MAGSTECDVEAVSARTPSSSSPAVRSTHERGIAVAFNRNIITSEDLQHMEDPKLGTPKTLDQGPPAPPTDGQAPQGDGFLTQLLKYVPVEVIGLHTTVAAIIVASVTD